MKRIVLPALLAVVVLAVLIGQALPTFDGWHRTDDFNNMRWVLEYRDAPWLAITERHSLHDHIRPMALVLMWLGARLSDGAWWGPHLLLGTLVAGAVFGVAAFTAVRTRSAEAGLLAALLATGLLGLSRLLSWNAWLSGAAELCFGWWALAAAAAAVRWRRPWLVAVAAGLVVLAGLSKESTWIVFTAGAVLLAVEARREGARTVCLGLLALVPVSLVGFAWTWHPANTFRMAANPRSILDRVPGNAEVLLGWLVDRWPLEGSDVIGHTVVVGGVLAPAAALGLGLLVVARSPRWAAGHLRAAALVGAGLLAAWWAAPALAPWLTGVVLVIAAVRCWPAPPPELGVALAAIVVMLPGQAPSAEHGTAAGLALAALVAAPLALAPRRAPLWVLAFAGMATARALVPARPAATDLTVEQVAKARGDMEGLAALASALGERTVAARPPLGALELAPLYGLEVDVEAPTASAGAEVGSRWVITTPPDGVQAWLRPRNLLGLDEPTTWVRRRTPRTIDPTRQVQYPHDLVWHDLSPGLYLVGFGAPRRPAQLLLSLDDNCGHRWTTLAQAPVPTHLSGVLLREGCSKVALTWNQQTVPRSTEAWLVPVDRVRPSLRGAPSVERTIEVSADAGYLHLFEGGGPSLGSDAPPTQSDRPPPGPAHQRSSPEHP